MQETAYLFLQEELEYPCKNLLHEEESCRAVKRLKIQTLVEEEEDFLTTKDSKPAVRLGHFAANPHPLKRSTKNLNGMKFRNIFGISSASSSSSSNKIAANMQQSNATRKGRNNF